jgi:hypothetical protein
MRAYIFGLVAGPFLLLGTAYVVNERGPETCETLHVWSVTGQLTAVRSCSGGLGLATREPELIATKS